jgi:hypothetical protein
LLQIDDPEYSKYWGGPPATAAGAAMPTGTGAAGGKYRHQWFQNAEKVEVNVLAKGLKKELVGVTIERDRLRVTTADGKGVHLQAGPAWAFWLEGACAFMKID